VFVVGEHRHSFVAAMDNLEYAVGKKKAAKQESHASGGL
jgi:hypothetical protein